MKPPFPRSIRLSLRRSKEVERDKPRQPFDLDQVKKARIISKDRPGRGYLIYPELYDGTWRPFETPGVCLASFVPQMSGGLSDRRCDTLRDAWRDWLDDWIAVNHLKINIEREEKSGKEPGKALGIAKDKKMKLRWKREYREWLKSNPDVRHETPRSEWQWGQLRKLLHETGGGVRASRINSSSDSIEQH